jgi:hypothetical protein
MPQKDETSQINEQKKSSKQEASCPQQKAKVVEEERGNQYGHIWLSHKHIGEQFRVILSTYYDVELPTIPPHICSAMLLGLKLIRCINPAGKFQLDDFVDMQNYMNFTRRMDPTNPEAINEDIGRKHRE